MEIPVEDPEQSGPFQERDQQCPYDR
jgi:hypothetical protein